MLHGVRLVNGGFAFFMSAYQDHKILSPFYLVQIFIFSGRIRANRATFIHQCMDNLTRQLKNCLVTVVVMQSHVNSFIYRL